MTAQEAAPTTRDSVRALIAQGRKTQAEKKLVNLSDDIDHSQAAIDLENSRHNSLRVQIETMHKEHTTLSVDLQELNSVEDELDPVEYVKARDLLQDTINKNEIRSRELTVEFDEMRTKITRLAHELDILRDKRNVLSDPDHRAKFPENISTEAYLDQVPAGLAEWYKATTLLPNRLVDLDPDLHAIHLQLTIHTCDLRIFQNQNPVKNAAEDLVYRRTFGVVVKLAQEYKLPYISVLNPKYQTDFTETKNTARRELSILLAKKKAVANAQNGTQTVRPVKEEAAETINKDELLLVEQLMKRRIPSLLSVKRVAFFGGLPSRDGSKATASWIEQALQLRSLRWYECYSGRDEASSLISSIRSGGTDIVVIFTQWMGHGIQSGVITACKNAHVKLVFCNSSSKREICRQLADAVGTRLDV